MGLFLAVSAVRSLDSEAVVDAVCRYLAERNVGYEPVDDEPTPDEDAAQFTSSGEWTIVLWPEYFLGYADVAQFLSRQLDALVLSVNIYDGDYWAQVVARSGEILDRFCSDPGYFCETEEEAEPLRQHWRGDAELLGKELGVASDEIRPYLVDVGELMAEIDAARETASSGFFDRLRNRFQAKDPNSLPWAAGKAHETDEFDLDDIWVFTDMWRRAGIVYPEDTTAFTARIRLDSDHIDKLSDYGTDL